MAARKLRPEDVSYLVVHCSATPATQDIGAKEIDRMHRLKGWLKIGYHFVIKRDGAVESGRGLDEIGAHVEDHNHESLGICLVGGTTAKLKPEANFTEEQYDALVGLLITLQCDYPWATIQGHRDFPGVAKACPSFDVKHWWATNEVRA